MSVSRTKRLMECPGLPQSGGGNQRWLAAAEFGGEKRDWDIEAKREKKDK
jgi:hypothetical protein